MLIAGFDTETTGLDPKEHRFVELSIQIWDTDTEKQCWRYETRINPERTILAEASRVHGIMLSDVLSCKTWKEVAPGVRRILDSVEMIVAHNGKEFDLPFLNSELERVGLSRIEKPLIDTMHARWATANGKLPSLGELCFACGVEYDPTKAHAADYDVEVMMKSYFNARRWGWFAKENPSES